MFAREAKTCHSSVAPGVEQCDEEAPSPDLKAWASSDLCRSFIFEPMQKRDTHGKKRAQNKALQNKIIQESNESKE